MKKNILRITMSLLLLSLITISCSKNKINEKNENYLIIGKTYKYNTSKSEQELTIGQLHNALLSDVYSSFNFNSSNFKNETFINFERILTEDVLSFIPENQTYKELIYSTISPNSIEILNNANELSIGFNDYGIFESNIVDLEVEIQSSDIETFEKEICLIYLDVLKNSTYFWSPISKGGSGEGYNILINLNDGDAPVSPAIADALGASGGFIGGALFTGLTGGAAGPGIAWAVTWGAAWASGMNALGDGEEPAGPTYFQHPTLAL